MQPDNTLKVNTTLLMNIVALNELAFIAQDNGFETIEQAVEYCLGFTLASQYETEIEE